MSILVSKAKEQIKNGIIAAAKKAIDENILEEALLTDFTVEVPSNREHGDYAVNAAMVWARLFHKAPRQIAEILTKNLETDNTYIKSFEIAGPGFINLFLNENYYADIVLDVEKKGADYLWVLEKNERAVSFYKQHGFLMTPDRKYEDGTTEYLVRMQK